MPGFLSTTSAGRLAVALALAALVARPSAANDEFEPNDTPPQAAEMETGRPFTIQLDPATDTDYFRFSPVERGILTVEVLECPPVHAGLHLWWLDRSGQVLRTGERDVRVDGREPVVLGVQSHPSPEQRQGSDLPIRLRIDFLPEPDPDEPDDTWETARQVNLGDTVNVSLIPRGETDMLRVTAPADGILTAKLLDVPEAHPHLWLAWIDDEGNVIRGGERDLRVGAGQSWTLSLTGNYYIEHRAASAEPVRLRLQFQQEPFDGEPNDTPERAQAVDVGTVTPFALIPRLDIDHFRLTAPADGVVTVRLPEVPEAHVAPYIWWLDDEGQEVRGGEWDRRVSAGQAIVFGIRSDYWDENQRSSAEPLQLSVEFAPEPFPGEPNDLPADAQELEFDRPLSFALTPRRDVDYFRVRAPTTGVVTLHVMERPELHPALYVWWLDEQGNTIRPGEWDCRIQPDSSLVVGIRSNYWSANERATVEPIRIRASFTPEPFPGEPNDTRETAQPIEFGTPVSLAFTPRRDVDVFKLVAPDNGFATVRLLQHPDLHHAIHIEWFDDEGRVIRKGEWDARVREGEETLFALRSNYWESDERATAEEVEIVVEFTPEPAPGEPNDTPEQAYEVTIGEPFSVAFAPRRDQDYFRTTAPGRGTLTVRLLEPSEAHPGAYIWWLDEEGKPERGGIWDARTAADHSRIFALRSNYWQENERASDERLRLQVDFLPLRDGAEPNDLLLEATPLSIGEEFDLTFTPFGDVDHFRIDITQDTLLRVEGVDLPEGLQPAPVWLDEEGQVVREWEWECWARRGTTLYLQLRSSQYEEHVRVWDELVRFRLDGVSTADAFEPNNDIERASSLDLNRQARAEWLAEDVDVYRVTLEEPGVYFADVSPRGVFRLRWTDRGGQLHSDNGELRLTRPGQAFLEVGSPDASLEDPVIPYQVRIIRIGEDGVGEPGRYPRRAPPFTLVRPSRRPQTAVIVRSWTFTDDREGWTLFGDARGGADGAVHREPGFLAARDNQAGETWYWVAPPDCLAELRPLYGGALEFSLRQSTIESQYDQTDVILEGEAISLVFDTRVNPGYGAGAPDAAQWTTYRLPLTEDAGWQQRGTGEPPTREQFQEALGGARRLYLRGEFSSEGDEGHLDNVRLLAPPQR